MNKLLLDNQRDVLLSTDALSFMQEAYCLLEKLSAFGGTSYILSGCVVSGTSVGVGYMVLGGQLAYCPAQTITTTLYIKKTETVVTKDSGSRTEYSYEVVFGTPTDGETSYTWATINKKRITDVIDLQSQIDALDNNIDTRLLTLEATETNMALGITSDVDGKITPAHSVINRVGKVAMLQCEFMVRTPAYSEGIHIMFDVNLPNAVVGSTIMADEDSGTIVFYEITSNSPLTIKIPTHVSVTPITVTIDTIICN